MRTTTREIRRTLRRVRAALAKRNVEASVELQIADPCPVAWETMTPVADGIRRCDTCKANVHDLTGASKRDIINRLHTHGAPLCGQVNARDDGLVVFGQCHHAAQNIRGMLTVR